MKKNKNKQTINILDLRTKLEENKQKISEAKRVKKLIYKQKGLLKTIKKTTDFQEPVMLLHRRGGRVELYENVTAGKFIFTHSDGGDRFIELRPEDQEVMDWGEKKIRMYDCHEDRPYAKWETPVVDGETMKKGYEMTKATDLKYQERIQKLKNAGKLTWVWILLGIAGAIAIVMFAWATWFAPAQTAQATAAAAAPPSAGLLMMRLKKWEKNFKK